MILRRAYFFVVLVSAAVLLVLALWVWPFVRGIWPAVGPRAPIPTVGIEPEGGESSGPLRTIPGWQASLLTDTLENARDIAVDSFGNLWVSQPSQGTVSLITFSDQGVILDISPVLRGLDRPHGLAFDPDDPLDLYVATETSILRVRTYAGGDPEQIASLPAGGRHKTRTLAFGSDGRLYVSIGSTCDTCFEKNPEHGSVISMNRDGSDRRSVAVGLRNAVFLTADERNQLWVTEMGRDHLGDDLPPDEINVIPLGVGSYPRNYGWPICYGDRIHDTQFDKNQYVRDPCADTFAPEVNLGAHVAPLGLAFIPRTVAWPADWRGDIVVAYHGSWNRSVPVGYEVVKFDIDVRGDIIADSETVIVSGFLVGSSALGRPVDVLPTNDGTLYISDDKAGAIWKLVQRK